MPKTIKIIGIGAGDPDHLTIQAVKALSQVDVVFLMDKGPAKEKLNALRKKICARHMGERAYRFVDAANPEREREGDYLAAVADLNARKQAVFERLIAAELRDGECGAFLVWGDPSLYDSTIRLVEAIAASGRHDLDWDVIPGITSVQALTARHRTTLNAIGRAVTITPGRRLAERFPDGVDSVVVMLDAENAFRRLREDDVDIYWGAYVGTPDEILIAGKLDDVAGEIERVRAEARAAHGWIMDSYLLRRPTVADKTSD
ncbi:precorrin-6A synthase (deacetylating) [Chenggangzhangella methanolivorans]|uniref:precorrin-6A synthase (deacetylating) n=1 Tax=Chenggangzhangella methanolivorans TaxID=1437009 RepID=UPI00361ECC1D